MKNKLMCIGVICALIFSGCEKAAPAAYKSAGVPSDEASASVTTTQVSETTAQSSAYITAAEYSELKLYDKKGTGGNKASWQKPTDYNVAYFNLDDNHHITSLLDTDVQGRINAEIDNAVARTTEMHDKLKQKAETDNTIVEVYDISAYCGSCINGYITFETNVSYGADYGDRLYPAYMTYYTESLVFDVFTGNWLDISDLFYDGVDFIPYYNKRVEEELNRPFLISDYQSIEIPIKREFSGITSDCAISLDKVAFNKDNPYFGIGLDVSFPYENEFFLENSLMWQKRDLSGVFNDEISVENYTLNYFYDTAGFTYKSGGTVNNVILDNIIDTSTVFDKDKINAANKLAYDIADSDEVEELLRGYLDKDFSTPMFTEEGWYTGLILDMSVYEKKNILNISIGNFSVGDFGGGLSYCYDLDTLERLSNEEVLRRVFGEDWQDTCEVNASFSEGNYTVAELAADPESVYLAMVYSYDENNGYIEFMCGKTSENENLGNAYYIAKRDEYQ